MRQLVGYLIFSHTRYEEIKRNIKTLSSTDDPEAFVKENHAFAIGFIRCGKLEGATLSQLERVGGIIHVFVQMKTPSHYFTFILPPATDADWPYPAL